jgi:hypothetical protein
MHRASSKNRLGSIGLEQAWLNFAPLAKETQVDATAHPSLPPGENHPQQAPAAPIRSL